MSHQDSKVRLNAVCLKQSLHWLLEGVEWSTVKFRDDCSWTPRMLSWAALLWAWSDELTLRDRFESVRRIIQFLCPRQGNLATSYQAFIKLLRRWTPRLATLLQAVLRHRMQEVLPDCWKVGGWIMFGVDGSRVELPRTRSHEAAYSSSRRKGKSRKRRPKKSCDKRHAKKANSPQMWITTMWHAGTQLPWDWRTGPADSSERAHLLEMLPGLPAGALVAADAGFVGYAYAKAVIESGQQLLVRVGANVRLLRKLGFARESAGTVYLWPDQAAKKNRPPVVLRLVVVENGRHPVYLLTSVLSKSDLSNPQVIELYRRRWGIEVFYRSLKQTFGRRKLRSTSAENARVEIEWSLLGIWAMALYALVEAHRCGTPPSKLSIAKTLRAFRRMLRDWRHPSERRSRLKDRLREAVIDSYVRKHKSSRDYPRKKQESPPGGPRIRLASKHQIQQAKAIQSFAPKKGLTA
jgi:hypothetical protein